MPFCIWRKKIQNDNYETYIKIQNGNGRVTSPESGPIHFKHLSLYKNKYMSEEYYFFLLSSQNIALDSRSCLLLKL